MHDHSERFRQLALKISYYRKKADLSQEQLAEKVGISRQHISGIEAPNTEWPFSLVVLFNICDALGVEPVQLFDFKN